MQSILIALLISLTFLYGEEGPKKYVDQPVHAASKTDVSKIELAIAPYIKKAKETYPAVKERYLKGLPAGSKLYITYRLFDGELVEVAFTRVDRIEGDKVFSSISNELDVVRNYRKGQGISFNESELLDWTIVDKNGEEEGNVVGKFLDTYKP